jgi:hypothetical protein
MILRADHIAGAAFILFGVAVFALSGDLPFGTLSFPGSGFMPKLVASLMIVFGLSIVLRAGEGPPFSSLDWGNLKHAVLVSLITAAAIYAYTELGFIVTVALLIFTLLVVVERRHVLPAALYALAVTLLTYAAFDWALKTPLPAGPWGF